MEKGLLILLLLIYTSSVFAEHKNNKHQLPEDLIIEIKKEYNKSDRQIEHIEYSYVNPDMTTEDNIACYSSYKVLSKDAGAYFCISIFNKEYKIADILDYGQVNLKVYKRGSSTLFLIGLDDFYGSTYFVYLFKANSLVRIGQIDINQPNDVEEHGPKTISFKVYYEDNRFIIENYLDGIFESSSSILSKNSAS